MTPRAARLLRGTLLGVVATVLAAVSHLVAGGPAPSALALALGLAFSGAVGTVAVGRQLAGRPVGMLRTAIGVGIAQLAFHLVFSILSTGAGVTVTGHAHHALVQIGSGSASAIAQGGAWMWLAHLAAGVGSVLYLRHLESRAWALLARLGGHLVATLEIVAAAPLADHTTRPVHAVRMPRIRHLHPIAPRRGPPRALTA